MSEGNEKIATLTKSHLEDTARLDAALTKERNLVQDQTENIRLLTEQLKKKQSDVNYANRELDKIKTQFEEAERVGGELFVSNQAELSRIYSLFANIMNTEIWSLQKSNCKNMMNTEYRKKYSQSLNNL